jgi:hypothetical protein
VVVVIPPDPDPVTGLAREVDGLRRELLPLRVLPGRVDELSRLLADLAESVTALRARTTTPAPSWLMATTEVGKTGDLLDELAGWLGAVYLRYPDAVESFPDCWCWHPHAVEELLWLMHAWAAAYQGSTASVTLVGEWHDRWRPGVVRRIKATAGICSQENHQTRDAWPKVASGAPTVPGEDQLGGLAEWWAGRRDEAPPEPRPRSGERDHRGPARYPVRRSVVWLPGLAVAAGAATATAHGLYEVAIASRVPTGVAWLYPLITDGLALVAYAATARLAGSAARYAWAVVVVAAGLSGLAQAIFLASDETLEATPAVRFGIGAWPAIAAAVVAHLLYLLAEHQPVHDQAEQPAVQPGEQPVVQAEPERLAAAAEPAKPAESPQRDRAQIEARAHRAAHGRLPTVSELQDLADVSRGTAAKALKALRDQPDTPTPLQLVRADENTTSRTTS